MVTFHSRVNSEHTFTTGGVFLEIEDENLTDNVIISETYSSSKMLN